jgi:cobalamin biosynthesis Mg chelatase CobN
MTDEASMDPIRRPRVLFVYYTYTQQSLRVVEAMADALRERGCEVRQAGIEFTDKRWAERFSRFPLRHA